MKKFFIVGCPRSGTTLLQQALNRHSQIAIPPETSFLRLTESRRSVRNSHLQRINEDLGIKLFNPPSWCLSVQQARTLFDDMIEQYLKRLDRSNVLYFGEKSPEHQRYLKQLRRLFPDAKVVLVYRDGRDVALSRTKVPWLPPDLYFNFAIWLHYYRIQHKARKAASPNTYYVKYEHLVEFPERELQGVLRFLEIPYESQTADASGNTEGVPAWEIEWKGRAFEKINKSRVGKWRDALTYDQIHTLETWGRAAFEELDYELTTDAKKKLPWTFFAKVYSKVAYWALTKQDFRGVKDGPSKNLEYVSQEKAT